MFELNASFVVVTVENNGSGQIFHKGKNSSREKTELNHNTTEAAQIHIRQISIMVDEGR